MGDMADYFLEQVEQMEEKRFEFRTGQIPETEAYELGIIDELGYEIGSGRSVRTCRCCGKTNLSWQQHRNGKWRLHDNRGVHRCPVNPLPEEL